MILGLGGFDHNGAVCTVEGGRVTAFLEAERPTRDKNIGLKTPAIIDATIAALGGCDPSHVALADARFVDRASTWLFPYLAERFPEATRTIHHHHDCHLAAAFCASPFERATTISIDAAGDGLACAIGVSTREQPAQRTVQVASKHSLGRLWWAVSEYCGMPGHHAAGKTMALAAYGEPRFLDAFASACTLLPDGRYEWADERFREMHTALAWLEAITNVPRAGELTQTHRDIAATMQAWTVRVVDHIVRHAVQASGVRDVCLAGGVALNGLANEALITSGAVDRLFVPPCPDDRGLALGAACLAAPITAMTDGLDPFLGPPLPAITADPVAVAKRLVNGDILAICEGGDEAGPRALGHRSILASPRPHALRERLNRMKGREQFRPFGCSLPIEHASEWLGIAGTSPYMLRIVDVPQNKRALIPAVVHVDGTTRPQTVLRERQPFFHALLTALPTLGHPPVLLNTSLNGRGEPLACTREDAEATAKRLGLDGII